MPCQIVTGLKDLDVLETDTIHLSVVLSKPRCVQWLIDSRPITGDSRFKATISDDELQYKLTIVDVSTSENAVFSAEIDDIYYGIKMSSCRVHVQGMWRNVVANLLLVFSRNNLSTLVATITKIHHQWFK